jgi:hypothetical protein
LTLRVSVPTVKKTAASARLETTTKKKKCWK